MFSVTLLFMIVVLFGFSLLFFIPSFILEPKGFTIEKQAEVLRTFYESLAYYDINIMQAFKYSYYLTLTNISKVDLGCDTFKTEDGKIISIWKNNSCIVDFSKIPYIIIKSDDFWHILNTYLDKIKSEAKKRNLYEFDKIKEVQIVEWKGDYRKLPIPKVLSNSFKELEKNNINIQEGFKEINIVYSIRYKEESVFEHNASHHFDFIFYDYVPHLKNIFKKSLSLFDQLKSKCFQEKDDEYIFNSSCIAIRFNKNLMINNSAACMNNELRLISIFHYKNLSLIYFKTFNLSFVVTDTVKTCSGRTHDKTTLFKYVCSADYHCVHVDILKEEYIKDGNNIAGVRIIFNYYFTKEKPCHAVGCVKVPIVSCSCYENYTVSFFDDNCTCIKS